MRDIVFINADDFGLNRDTNDAIVYCLVHNMVSTTTLLANMQGFYDAINKIQKYNLYGRVGIHFNLTDGYPISAKMKSYLKKEGLHKLSIKHLYSNAERYVIYQELSAQLKTVMNNGVIPTHIDTHRSTHNYFDILRIINTIAKEYRIRYIRNTINLYIEGKTLSKMIFKKLYQAYLRYKNIQSSKYFTYLHRYISNNCQLTNVELMCHPGETPEFSFLCSAEYKEFLLKNREKIVFQNIFP